MRRALVAGCALLAVFAAGCGAPAGADGDLVDDWTAAAAPKPFTPDVGACLFGAAANNLLSGYNATDCATSHVREIVHVGQIATEATTPPKVGSKTARGAFDECDAQARQYLGGDWRATRLDLEVLFPSPPAWSGGARWFRCDVLETPSLDSGEPVTRSGRLRDALKAASPLHLGCFQPTMSGDEIDEMKPVKCTQKHRSEFVGVWTAPDTPYSDFTRSEERAHAACRGVVATYAKVPNDSNLRFRTGTVYYPPTAVEWALGDRGVRCLFWYDRDVSRSIKAAGPSALPIR
ncbi:septum formation family protein [Actinomycetes bacterium KLBMP 9797]